MKEIVEVNNKKSKNKISINSILIIIMVVILSFVLGVLITLFYDKTDENIVRKESSKNISEIKVSDGTIENAIDKIYEAVLCIQIVDQNENVLSSGSGFIYDKSEKYGYVLTNAHVVEGATYIQGIFTDQSVVNLELLGYDTYLDLAVLRLDAKYVKQVASLGKSSNIKVGNTVFAVGSPMGSKYLGTVTKGILSGKDRLIETSTSSSIYSSGESYIVKVMQTDTAISPGNSGGPLVDLAGDVIGINSLKLVDEQVEGMGFAIPIEDAMNYVDILSKGRKIERPIMGVQILDLTNKMLLDRYGIKYDKNVKDGVILLQVNEGYPAADGGLKEMDIVTKINGQKIKTGSEFKYELYKYPVGSTVDVTFYRNGKEKTAKIKLNKTK